MTWIATVPPEAADGALKRVYDAIASARGGVANIHRAQSLNVAAMKAHLELYKAILFQRSSLSRIDRERIAVVVSNANKCAYCIAHHAEALRSLRDDPTVIETLARGDVPDALSPGARRLLAWARLGAIDPSATTESDLHELRAVGFDDRAITDAARTVAYFSFVNRLVLLLGVDLESDFATTCRDRSDDDVR